MPTVELPCPICGQHLITVSVGQVVQLLFVKFTLEISGVN